MDSSPSFYDLEPSIGDFHADVVAGLASESPTIAPKYFYDDRGSELFRQICTTDEYYVTRTEIALLKQVVGEIVAAVGADAMVLELGVGMSAKVEILLSALKNPALYAAAEINRMALEAALAHLSKKCPDLPLAGIVTDFTRPWRLPEELANRGGMRLCFLPGSTVGNFSPEERQSLLCSIRELIGEGGQVLIGTDLIKDKAVLERAYNDEAGYTARFNLNLLYRLQRELNARVNPETFRHYACYNSDKQRVEMHLVAQSRQEIQLGDRVFSFEAGDSIHTENSYKFSVDEWEDVAKSNGFSDIRYWTDQRNWFGLFLLTV